MANLNIVNNLDILDDNSRKKEIPPADITYTGDTKVINEQKLKEKISPLMASAILGMNNTSTPGPYTSKYNEIWTDIDAQELYMNAKPTCYIILSKPGLADYSLGEAISKKYQCVHLCPKNIIQDEILQDSLTGRCLDYNMKQNKVCAYDTILPMLKIKLQSKAVQYRGYVLSGLPLITASSKATYMVKPKYTEEAFSTVDELLFDVICNLNKKKKKHKPTESATSSAVYDAENMEEDNVEEEEEEEVKEEIEEEEEEGKAELPKFILNSCSDILVTKKHYLETTQATFINQLQEIFNLDLKPNVLIYVTCPDADVVTIKHHKYKNYKNSQNIMEPFFLKANNDLRWPLKYPSTYFENPPDFRSFSPKYCCRQPINFKKEATIQLCNYKNTLSYIEKKIMDFDPKHVIKLDGRTSMYQMMNQISERLILMDLVPVLIPEPLYQEPTDDLEEFWAMVNELNVIRNGDLSFRRCASPWLNRCPVELSKRRTIVGKTKFSVTLFNHVYLLSSVDNFVSFCMNPRPFLKLKYLEPTCRIFITGTKSSGKTMIAQCMSWLFNTPVFCFKTFYDSEKELKYERYSKRILSEIIATIEDSRLMTWKSQELDRTTALAKWCKKTLDLLKQYIPLLKKYLAVMEKQKKNVMQEENMEEQEEENREPVNPENPENPEVAEDEQLDPKVLKKMNNLKEQLSFFPFLHNMEICKHILASKEVSEYGPPNLVTPIPIPTLPMLGDEDVTQAIDKYIIDNDLTKEILPNHEELNREILKILSDIDLAWKNDTNSDEYGRYIIDGFPTDPEHWEFLRDEKMMPDYTLAIIENREIDAELCLHYMKIDKCVKNPLEVLLEVKDPLILCKLQTKAMPEFKELNVNNIIFDLISGRNEDTQNEIFAVESIDPEFIAKFTENIEKFREEWDSVKIKLEEASKCFVEVQIVEDIRDTQVLEEILLNFRKCYFLQSQENDEGEAPDDEEKGSKDILSYNNPQLLCETGLYCPYSFYNFGLLWEGKREFSLKYDNRTHNFAKEEFMEKFRQDITKYQAYNKPFKKLPKLKICIIGSTGSGVTSLSKRLATELGLIHIEFIEFINNFCMPRHFKKVGRKYENPFTSQPFDEEGVVDFQLDEENSMSAHNIMSNESELRRIIYNYYERGQPILSTILQPIIKRIWFTQPYNDIGFILDGFPRLSQDVEDMIQCNCIPDLVIYLQSTSEVTIERLGPAMLRQWKSQLNEAKDAHETMVNSEKKKWTLFIMKRVVVNLIIEEVLDLCGIENEPLNQTDIPQAESFILDAHPSGSTFVDPYLFTHYNKVVEEYPEPDFARTWDKPADVRESIDARLEALFESDNDSLEGLLEQLTDNNIKIETFDATKSFNKIMRHVLLKLENLKNRNESFLEETYIISNDIAELLLAQGFFFLSKCGRLCPVYIYENPQAKLNSYKISKRKGKLFPVVHRTYIYFISNEDYVTKFRRNPLKYVTSNAVLGYLPFPLRIGIIGAPKTGKSSLAAKLAKRYNLKYLSIGTALRYVTDYMPWTELGTKILKQLNEGQIVYSDYILDAVQTAAIDHLTVTYGFVFDGFPSSPYEAIGLDKYGLYPNVVFDITSNKEAILESSQNEIYYNILKYLPPYSISLIDKRFQKWNEQCLDIINWINNDYQNICILADNESKWKCFEKANDAIAKLMSKIHYYLANVKTNVVSVSGMNVSNLTFKERQSSFKNLCPACIRKHVLRSNSYPVDKSGVVQFNNTFYWICPEHKELVLQYPCYYLLDTVHIPEIPAVVKMIKPDNVYENGICIVTYAENLPEQKLVRGSNQFAATYKRKTYLCCSDMCLRKFLDTPHCYFDITVFKETSWFPKLSLNKLPDLGYLEQTLANVLTQACCSVNVIRPKYPGLDSPLSAVLYIALYLKTHNKLLPAQQVCFYQKALNLFEARCKLIIDLGLRMRSMDNPFNAYPTNFVQNIGSAMSDHDKTNTSYTSLKATTNNDNASSVKLT